MTNPFVDRARALVGTRFRPQGRSPETGLDCVGLALAVFGIRANAVRRDYRLRGAHGQELSREVLRFFRRVGKVAAAPGDLVISSVALDQLHLSIISDGAFVHADGRIGRVVETPGTPSWPCEGVYRRRVRGES
ncbi:peptidoglycan endopeptidase [Sphingomonas sp.]|uniref:peptidoglycan endopeptidase n=1 Tax=Sphingomonas sp. TaxID=28214 RepID=UPI0025D94907|nr:peptidoglycan endopeptidase [Sphingomonas sp.]MBV9529258.1 C40 family peptidase [Sphingomonas sp.]